MGKVDLLHLTRRIVRDGLILNSAFANRELRYFLELGVAHKAGAKPRGFGEVVGSRC